MGMDTHELVRSAAARRLPAPPGPPKRVASREVEAGGAPPVLKLVQTGFEDQMPALQRAMDGRRLGAAAAAAAGAADAPSLDDLGSLLDARDDVEPGIVNDDPFDQLSRVLGDGEE
jgi:hypothetical protein